MSYEFNGSTIETNEKGYLNNIDDWSEELAVEIAKTEDLELTEQHWDIINYLRDEFINNHGNQPNMRSITKAMKDIWGGKVDTKSLYSLFPMDPSKQAGKIGGLPESRRKGGY